MASQKTTLRYKGKNVPVKLDNGTLFRIELSGVDLRSLESSKTIATDILKVGKAMLGIDGDLADCVDDLPPVKDITAAITNLSSDAGGEEGNADAAG